MRGTGFNCPCETGASLRCVNACDGADLFITSGRRLHLEGAGSDPVVVGEIGRELERVTTMSSWEYSEGTPTNRNVSGAKDCKTIQAKAPRWAYDDLDKGQKPQHREQQHALRYTCRTIRKSDRVNACDEGLNQKAFLTPHNGARASAPSVLNLFPVHEAGYCMEERLVVPIHKSEEERSLKSLTYALVVRPLSVLNHVPGTQTLQVVSVTGAGGGRRASSRGGVKAGKRPVFRMRNGAPAGPERGLRTRPLRVRILALVMGIGALAGFERGLSVSARVLSRCGAAWTNILNTYVPRGRDGGGWITARSEVVIDGGTRMIFLVVERQWEGGRWAKTEPEPARVPVPEPLMA